MELYEISPLPSYRLKARSPLLYWLRIVLLCYVVVHLSLVLVDDVEAAGESDYIDDFTGDTGDAEMLGYDAVYNTAWSASAAYSVTSAGTTLKVGQWFYLGNFYIYRSVLIFDTSSIPDYANVTHAWVEVTVHGDSSTSDEFYYVPQVGSAGVPAYPVVLDDWDKSLYTGDAEYLSTTDISVAGVYYLPIDPAAVNKTSYSEVMVRSSRDVDGNSPTGAEYTTFYSSNHGTSAYHPKLTVVYASDYAVMSTNETDSDDGLVYKQDAVFLTAWNALTGTVQDIASVSVGYNRVTSDYRIDRGMVFIDTAGLPDDINLTRYNATLLVYLYNLQNDQDFTVHVQNGQPTYPHDPLVVGDYAKSNYMGGISGGNLNNTSTLSASNWYPIQINSSWVNPTGQTKLCFRSDRDIYGDSFVVDSWLNFVGDESPYRSVRLILESVYVEPEPPEEPPVEGGGEDDDIMWWNSAMCSSWAITLFILMVVIGIIGLAGRSL